MCSTYSWAAPSESREPLRQGLVSGTAMGLEQTAGANGPLRVPFIGLVVRPQQNNLYPEGSLILILLCIKLPRLRTYLL